MVNELLRKWFNLDPIRCETCEVLRSQLDESNRERRELLMRVMNPPQVEPLPEKIEENFQPIKNQFIPWRIRQQMLEAEDKKQFQIKQQREKEIAALEVELQVNHDVPRGESGGVKFEGSIDASQVR